MFSAAKICNMNCKNCKFWGKDYHTNEKGFADCANSKGIEIKASAADDSGLSAELFTHETFGCICFKQK